MDKENKNNWNFYNFMRYSSKGHFHRTQCASGRQYWTMVFIKKIRYIMNFSILREIPYIEMSIIYREWARFPPIKSSRKSLRSSFIKHTASPVQASSIKFSFSFSFDRGRVMDVLFCSVLLCSYHSVSCHILLHPNCVRNPSQKYRWSSVSSDLAKKTMTIVFFNRMGNFMIDILPRNRTRMRTASRRRSFNRWLQHDIGRYGSSDSEDVLCISTTHRPNTIHNPI